MDDAPAAGTYEQLNIFGSPTGVRINVRQGQPLSAIPEGHNWMLTGDGEDEC